mmetsp:Transcript_55913/g.120332  ORF Transcript_55913/g.120332 Transcript_55913/m.120332 type:complete len:231 (+) Transcript_55913:82-774(+)
MELRFVSITASQASSFIRIMRPSFVMPALFTRMSGVPYFSVMASMTLSMSSALVTSSFMPSPTAPRRSEIAAAPESEVAVPTTTAPALASCSAIAAPIPRVAPVTNATLPARLWPSAAPPLAARRVAATAAWPLGADRAALRPARPTSVAFAALGAAAGKAKKALPQVAAAAARPTTAMMSNPLATRGTRWYCRADATCSCMPSILLKSGALHRPTESDRAPGRGGQRRA